MLAFPFVTLVHGIFLVRNSQRVRVIDCCDWTSEGAHYVLSLIAVTARWGTGYYEVTELLKKVESCWGPLARLFQGTRKRKSVESVLRVLYTFVSAL